MIADILAEVEAQIIGRSLIACKWDADATAAQMGISRRTLQEKMRRLAKRVKVSDVTVTINPSRQSRENRIGGCPTPTTSDTKTGDMCFHRSSFSGHSLRFCTARSNI